MKYFVTGTTGFVGGHVARQLVEAGHEVVALVRNPAKAGDLKNLGVQMPEMYSAEYLRVSAGETYIGSNAKARREWGYDPRPLEEGLKETLEHEMKLLGMR